ncbi:hypothetical protein [Archaeoglobus veneficus]|uniref:hypothetical protein n=1 Tax=Archaeoglobus veneficus TaxID=58290 RepID=UPI000AEDCC96|nr:hypothetical protein [Archaeoglobus veneficus]
MLPATNNEIPVIIIIIYKIKAGVSPFGVVKPVSNRARDNRDENREVKTILWKIGRFILTTSGLL